jgi:hypothetical protein
MTINSMTPEDRRTLAEIDEAFSVPPAQEAAAELALVGVRVKSRAEGLLAGLTPKERTILETRFKRERA